MENAKGGTSRTVEVQSPTPMQEANERMCEALEALQRAEHGGGSDPVTGQTADALARNYYCSLRDIFRLCNEPGNWTKSNQAKEHLPRCAIFVAGQILDDLTSGRLPDSIKCLFMKPGRPGTSAIQQRAIEAAVRYVEVMRAIEPNSKSPVPDVAERFGVTERAVQRWVENYRLDPLVLKPALNGQSSSKQNYLATLKEHMLESGRLYRQRQHVKRTEKKVS